MKLNYRQLALELTMKIMAVTALSYFIKTVLENYMMRPLQNSFSPDSRHPNTGFRLFSPPITPNFTQIPP